MTKKLLTLTIVIPVFNDKNHLKDCLDSIAALAVAPQAVIVVDNNSTDGSAELARTYPFVRVIKEKRQGVVYARDTGFDAVKTDLIGRIDSDTILPTGWMQPVVEFYSDNQHQKYALTGGCSFYNVRFSYFVSWCVDQFVFRYNRLLMGHYILYGSNMVITTQQWKDVRNLVCHKIDVHEDLDLAIHLHRIGYEITYREGWKVGVEMRRVLSRRRELWDNIMMWPKTLKHHGKKTWVFGWIGSVFFYLISSLAPLAEWIARVLGHSPLSDD